MHRLNPGRRGIHFGWLAGAMSALAIAAAPAALHAQTTRLNGDVTNDNAVDQVDAQAVLRGIVDLPMAAGQDLSYGDANCDGKVTAIDAQIILMKAASMDVSALCVNRAVGLPVAAITVDPPTGKVVAGGFPLQLNAIPFDASNTALSFKTIIWTSDDVSKATVSSAGLVQGIDGGSVNISATNGSITTIIPITVETSTTITMTVSPSAALADVGRTVPLALELRDAANNLLPDRAVVWKSSNPKIAAVNASTGVVTGVAPGNALITADAGNGVVGNSTVTVVSTGSVTRRWNGKTSTDWNTASNWDENAVPVPTDTVQIPAGTPNVATLTARTVIAGVKVLENATLALAANELQITGRLEVDGQITGTGKLSAQGLNQSTTYVRGALPNLTVIGQTELTDDVSISGSLEIVPNSTIRIRGRKLNVAKDLNARGGVIMTEKTDLLDVRGNARFGTEGSAQNWTTGTFKLGGNLVIYSPVKNTLSPVTTSGTHRTILNGTSPQIVADTGVTTVTWNELDISTSSVEFRSHAWNGEPDSSRFVFNGRVLATIASTVTGGGRVVAMSGITTAGGTVSLVNLAVRGLIIASGTFSPDTLTMLGALNGGTQLIPSGSQYVYNDLVIAGVNKFAGATTINDGLTLGCLTTLAGCTPGGASLTVGGNTVAITGDLRQSPLATTTPLIMDNDADVVIVNGGILGPVGTDVGFTPSPASLPVEFTVNGTEWKKGGIKVRGNVALRGIGAPGLAEDTHKFMLDGASAQSLRLTNGFKFNELLIANTNPAGVTHNDTTISGRTALGGRIRTGTVAKNLTISTATKLTGDGKLIVNGDVQTAPGSSVDIDWISIGSVQRVSGSWAPDTTEYASTTVAQTIQNLSGYKHVLVSGLAAFGGNINITNGLVVMHNGQLDMERRNVTVTGTTTITGILRMQDARDTLTIDGNVSFNRSSSDLPTHSLVTAGVLRVSGNITGPKPGGFYPTGTHKTVWNTGNVTTVTGDFNDFEVATKVLGTTGSPLLTGANIRGDLTATSGQARLTISGGTVHGDAVLTQPELVTLALVTTFKGNLTINKVKSTGTPLVEGNFTIIDAGELDGALQYKGGYQELGTITNPHLNFAWLFGLNNVEITTQPATTGTVGQNLQPGPVITMRNSLGQPITGSSMATITSSTGGTVNGVTSYRVLVTNGTPITLRLGSAGAQTLTIKLQIPGTVQATTNTITINP